MYDLWYRYFGYVNPLPKHQTPDAVVSNRYSPRSLRVIDPEVKWINGTTTSSPNGQLDRCQYGCDLGKSA
jgi:hypothetical protein